jgi:hypothetical protein
MAIVRGTVNIGAVYRYVEVTVGGVKAQELRSGRPENRALVSGGEAARR